MAQEREHVVKLRKATGYGRARLSRQLWQREHLARSPNTSYHILRSHGLVQRAAHTITTWSGSITGRGWAE